jgi:hypothetical protein
MSWRSRSLRVGGWRSRWPDSPWRSDPQGSGASNMPQVARTQQRRRAQVGEGVGGVGHGLPGELDVGEADHRMRPLPLGPSRPSWRRGRRTRACCGICLPGGVVDPTDMGQGVDGIVQHVCRVWRGPSARHSPETNSSGLRRAADRSGAAPWPSSIGLLRPSGRRQSGLTWRRRGRHLRTGQCRSRRRPRAAWGCGGGCRLGFIRGRR